MVYLAGLSEIHECIGMVSQLEVEQPSVHQDLDVRSAPHQQCCAVVSHCLRAGRNDKPTEEIRDQMGESHRERVVQF